VRPPLWGFSRWWREVESVGCERVRRRADDALAADQARSLRGCINSSTL
jgi:hypothetical protein